MALQAGLRRWRALAVALGVAAALPAPGLGNELARGRPVRWTRPPNYSRCTDPADSLQLTDGRLAPGDYIWLDRRSVGWEAETGDPIGLWVDLGRSCQLDSVVVCTAVCASAEVMPPSLLCAAGETTARLAWAGALEARRLAPGDSTRARRVRVQVALAGRGRCVLVTALLRGPFFFADEIEVHGRELPAATSAAPQATPGPLGRAFDIHELAVAAAAQRRTWALRRALPDPLADVARSLHLQVASEESLRLATRARRWRAAGEPALRVRRVSPWAPTTPWSDLQPAVEDTLELWPGGWGAAAVEIAGASATPVRVALALAAPRAGAPQGTLRLVLPVESHDGRWNGDALPLLSGAVALQPGEVRQAWIDVDASGASPGFHTLHLAVGSQVILVPVRVHRAPLGAPPVHAFTWTYPEKFALTRAASADAVRDNAAHGIDTGWIPAEVLPWPAPHTIDERGHLTGPLDFTACDRQLALYRTAFDGEVCFFWNFDVHRDDPSGGRFRHPYGGPAWQRAVREWLDEWLGHLDALGYDRARVVMQPVDETTAPAATRLFRMLHQLRPDLHIALTVTRLATPAELRQIAPELAVAILERRTLAARTEWAAALRRRGAQVWTYDVPQPSKAAPPLGSYRHLAWEAWARGLQGCGFWAYGDAGETSADAWDDFDGGRPDYAVVYGKTGSPLPLGESFVPSKRWQAFRIGMQETALFEAVRARDPGWPAAVLEAIATGGAMREPEQLRRHALEKLR